VAGKGLKGDRHFNDRRPVTLVSRSELELAAANLGLPIEPGSTRRNLTLSLESLPTDRRVRLRVGEVVLEVIGECAPCRIMETSVGPGACAALCGHRGVTATVLRGGVISVGAPVEVIPDGSRV
jgi:MOSC domain-containing protein YiiM